VLHFLHIYPHRRHGFWEVNSDMDTVILELVFDNGQRVLKYFFYLDRLNRLALLVIKEKELLDNLRDPFAFLDDIVEYC